MSYLRHVTEIDKLLKRLERINVAMRILMSQSSLKELYRGLKSSRAVNTSNNIMIHTTNIINEINQLESALLDSKTIFLQKAKYNE